MRARAARLAPDGCLQSIRSRIDEDLAVIAMVVFVRAVERFFQPGLVGLRTVFIKIGGLANATRAVVKTRVHAANKGIVWIGLGHDSCGP